MRAVESGLASIGGPILQALEFIGELVMILGEAISRLFRHKLEARELTRQMAFIGSNSVPIVALTTLSSGAVIALYVSEILVKYGAQSLAGATVGLAVVREIAPVLGGIMVAARCGSAIAAQIGTMVVTEQVDALRSLNVPPVNYLVVPRLLAAALMLPMLGLIGMFAGVGGGYLVAVMGGGVPEAIFMDSVRQFVTIDDVWKGLLKTFVFGIVVAMVSCQQGLRVRGGAEGVGRATTQTVVISMVLVYVLNYFLSAWLYRLGS